MVAYWSIHKIKRVPKPCACGCGEITLNRFIHGHTMRGIKHGVNWCDAQRQGLKRAHREGKFKNAKPLDYAAIAEKNRGRKRPDKACDATRAGVLQAWADGAYDGTKSAAGPNNASAGIWRLRDPRRAVHEFRSVTFWVKNNERFFAPDDVQWHRDKRGHWKCRAVSGLQSLSPRKKHPSGSWKGWTWYSQTERLKNDGADLLS